MGPYGSVSSSPGASIVVQIIDSCPSTSAFNYCKTGVPANERCGDGSKNSLDIDINAYTALTGAPWNVRVPSSVTLAYFCLQLSVCHDADLVCVYTELPESEHHDPACGLLTRLIDHESVTPRESGTSACIAVFILYIAFTTSGIYPQHIVSHLISPMHISGNRGPYCIPVYYLITGFLVQLVTLPIDCVFFFSRQQ